MIGSSAAQQITALDSVLALITKPDMVQKNIEALKEKIIQSEEAVSLAREEQAKAREFIASRSSREEELLAKINEINLREASHQAERASLDEYSTGLAARDKALADAVKANEEKVKILDNREVIMKSMENDLKGRSKDLELQHTYRMSRLDQRDKELEERELKLVGTQSEIKKKMDKLKELAG